MFSITTIESSITRPIATVIAPKVIMLIVTSSCFKTKNAIKIDIGIETTAISVERTSLKKSRITMIANTAPSNAFSNIVLIESSIGFAWSIISTASMSSLFFK